VVQVLLGVAAGRWLARGPLDSALVARLFVAAALLLALGYAWSLAMPLNKKLWTSSYVVHTAGLALMTLAVFVQALDLRGHHGPLARTAVAFGRNALLVFFLSGLVPRLLALVRWREGEGWTSPLSWTYRHVFAALPGDPRLGSLAYAVVLLALFALLAVALHRRRWYWHA
jgi:predicted acyltransferase